MTESAPELAPGDYVLDASCPRCGERTPIAITLDARLTVERDKGATLRPTLKAKASPHSCGQIEMGDDGAPTLEYAQS